MPGTAVELVPGGLFDRLVATAEPDALSAVRASAAAGAPARALAELDDVAGADPVAVTAWRHFAWHSCWLGLPDGGARPMGHLIRRMFDRPPRPRPEVTIRPEDWIVGRLLTDLRDTRATATLGLLTTAGVQLGGGQVDGIAAIVEARGLLADRPDLQGQLDLLAADMAARANDQAAAEGYLVSARQRLTAAGDARGIAAAALIAGDLYAASMTSPLAWNCVLINLLGAPGVELDEQLELREFTGSPAAVAEAAACYDDAEARYVALGVPSGVAAVGLRRAYLEILAGRPAEAAALASRARESFGVAGRPLDAATAAVHAALAAIAADVLPADIGVADLVVAAAPEVIGHAPALGLGLLCCRVGRHWAGSGGQPEWALAALGLAERVFAGLGDPLLHSQAAAAIGAAAASVGNVAAVRLAVRDALSADAEPLAEPADPTDTRRQRRAMLAARLYVLANQVRDVDGMERASAALDDALEPLRRGLAGYTGLAGLAAKHLLTLADLPGNAVAGLLYRARAARDEGQTAWSEDLLAEALAEFDKVPAAERDFSEALVRAYAGDREAASAAFERYARQELPGATEGGQTWRMIHVQSLAFQLNAGNTALARSHLDALRRAGPHWWVGLGEGWEHLGLVGRLLEQEGDLPAALAVLDEGLGEIEAMRGGLRRDELKTSFFAGAGVQNSYLDAARVALRLAENGPAAWYAKAFDYAERARSRALRDVLAANVGVEGAGLPADLVDRWRAAGAEVTLAQDRLAGLIDPPVESQAALAAARDRLRTVELELQRVNPRFWTAVNPQVAPDDLGTVAAAVPEGAAVLQYVVGPRDLLAWAVNRAGLIAPHRREDDAVAGLPGLVSTMVGACATGRPYQAAAADLADLLLEPLRPAIEAATTIYVIPSGPLARVPFGALPWNGDPLSAAVPITVLPSAGTPAAATPARPVGGRPLVVGNPSDMAYQASDAAEPVPQRALPAAGVEAWQVAELLDDADLLLGQAATEDRVRELLPGAPIAHFATHGVLDREAPLGTAILLASGESLTAAELFGVRLDADLVVLSACRTGTGTVVRGDELLGLGRALVAAGARAVLVTLWAIDDLSAALLMTEFYRRRSAGESDAVALQSAAHQLRRMNEAQAGATFEQMAAKATAAGHGELADMTAQAARELGREPTQAPYAHPYHWAPFVLISTRR